MKIVLLMLTALQLWAGDVYPTLFAKMGDPLFSYAAKTGALKSDAKLGGSVSAYVRQAQSVREDGLRVQQSGTAQERNAYLGELRSLQKTHDRLMVDVKREVLSAQKAGDTKRVMRIVSTEPAVMRDDFRLRDTLVAFYTQKRLEGKSAFMDALVRDSRRDIRYAKDGPDMPANMSSGLSEERYPSKAQKPSKGKKASKAKKASKGKKKPKRKKASKAKKTSKGR